MGLDTSPSVLPGQAVPDELLNSITSYVEEYMSHYDGSHDYNHIKRVLSLARTILSEERKIKPNSGVAYNDSLVTLGALLHDVGDKKYLAPGQDASTLVQDVLVEKGAPHDLAARVQDLVLHVSYSSEVKNPQGVVDKLLSLPELAIVQDADRLDAIGAVGVARCFAFTGAKGGHLEGAIEHFQEKLERLESMMKTETGKKLARTRTERIVKFREWWEEEAGLKG
ncbi:Uncharacterized protein CTRI78_v006789 [Colletotrichum trifolii]|uniref:HD/PDEase domain-containing protein n=1 Tax=Colletotrichum trifolii TaxID=5466 RepID=A0A4R8RBN8_COLTR|nr:Uncharacterized protein CTRI78_v006789 [Colletotrichum trifolii]